MILGGEVTEEYFQWAFEVASGVHPNKRGYSTRKRGLFQKFPRDIRWHDAVLGEADLQAVSLIRNEENWLALGGFLREPLAAARWSNDHPQFLNSMRTYHKRMLAGSYPKFPALLVGPENPQPGELVILDGNHRITAACMGGIDYSQLTYLVGVSPNIAKWTYYRDSPRLRKILTTLTVEL